MDYGRWIDSANAPQRLEFHITNRWWPRECQKTSKTLGEYLKQGFSKSLPLPTACSTWKVARRAFRFPLPLLWLRNSSVKMGMSNTDLSFPSTSFWGQRQRRWSRFWRGSLAHVVNKSWKFNRLHGWSLWRKVRGHWAQHSERDVEMDWDYRWMDYRLQRQPSLILLISEACF